LIYICTFIHIYIRIDIYLYVHAYICIYNVLQSATWLVLERVGQKMSWSKDSTRIYMYIHIMYLAGIGEGETGDELVEGQVQSFK
jgi:hypothetical protein